jgi:ABC-type glycerol-3-phosphate transport system substrate-binding protein
MSVRASLGLAVLLAGLLLSACGGGAPGGDSVSASLAESTPKDHRESMQLVVLHTNDNWGETEPCG